MKLNLLPTYVSKEGQVRTAMIGSVLLGVACVAGAAFMKIYSDGKLAEAKQRVADLQPQAAAALAEARKADEIIKSGEQIDRNIKLADAMLAHSAVYPKLYREVLAYIPTYFRITSIQAAPVNETSCTVTMTGVIHTYQQYADLMLAMLRIPGAQTVSRGGYQIDSKYVPNLSDQDQIGLPINPGEAPLPSNGFDRFQQLIARAEASTNNGFLNAGGFGSGTPDARGAMPGWSQITVGVLLADVPASEGKPAISRNLMTPDPRATLSKPTGGPAPNQTPAPGGGQVPGPTQGGGPGGGRPSGRNAEDE